MSFSSLIRAWCRSLTFHYFDTRSTESLLRRGLFEETGGMYPELITRPDIKVFLPPIGGLTAYICERCTIEMICDIQACFHQLEIRRISAIHPRSLLFVSTMSVTGLTCLEATFVVRLVLADREQL